MLYVTKSRYNGKSCVAFFCVPRNIVRIIHEALICHKINDERYRLCEQAGAEEVVCDEHFKALPMSGLEGLDSWVLIEFHQPNYQPFVDLLNKLIAEAK